MLYASRTRAYVTPTVRTPVYTTTTEPCYVLRAEHTVLPLLLIVSGMRWLSTSVFGQWEWPRVPYTVHACVPTHVAYAYGVDILL